MLCLPYYAYVFFSTKLEIRAEQFCLEVGGGSGWGREQEGEMIQTMYVRANK
jgi:hypothetical protein